MILEFIFDLIEQVFFVLLVIFCLAFAPKVYFWLRAKWHDYKIFDHNRGLR